MTHEELQSAIAHVMFDAMNEGAGWLTAEEIAPEVNMSADRVTLASRALVNSGYLQARYNARTGARYQLTEKGFVEIEAIRLEEQEGAEATGGNPIDEIEHQLAPAAGRMVTFGDNQPLEQQALSTIAQAEEVIRSSNTLDDAARDEALVSIAAGKSLLEKAKVFAVGAFRYLVWDRIKAVIEGGIEDAYRVVLTGLLITIGTIILGLL